MKKSRSRPAKARRPAANGGEAMQALLPLERAGGRCRVGIVDDHPMTRSGIAHLINLQSDLFVAFEAATPAEAMKAIAQHAPDLLLTDLTMEGRSGLEFIKDLNAVHPQLRVLVLSMHDEQIVAERALRSGARGYVMKDQGGEVLLEAIRRVLGGEIFLSPHMTGRLLRTLSGDATARPSSPIAKLTDREFQVLTLLGEGKSTQEIAAQLRISDKTVGVHRTRLRDKLELESAAAVTRFAVRWNDATEH